MKATFYFFLLITLPFAAFADTMTVRVYQGNSDKNPENGDCSKVYASTRSIPKTKMIASAALSELFEGPTEQETATKFISLFSKASADILIHLKIRKGVAYVNLKGTAQQTLSNATTSCGRDMFFAQTENTLKQFPAVKEVFFAIDGKPTDFYDWMELECPKKLGRCDGKEFL